jgi:hypothetical protein
VNAALPDDEDGVSNPSADLVFTVGAHHVASGFTLFDVPNETRTATPFSLESIIPAKLLVTLQSGQRLRRF